MTITVKARYANGQLTPLEPLDLEEGAEVMVSVEGGPALAAGSEREGPLLRVLRKVQERQAELPPDTWDNVPTDLVRNKKHYLYGHPNDEE
jgi:predicted DNA-binding antitoxin AbrB/MazE fold protein